MSKTRYECTAYFRGIDGLGNCDDRCQWWRKEGCVCAKGSERNKEFFGLGWDGKEYDSKEKRDDT